MSIKGNWRRHGSEVVIRWCQRFFLVASRLAFAASPLNSVAHNEKKYLWHPGYRWNALLTKTLPMFLSRLNEISGGCEKITPVSGSFWSNLKFFRMMDLTAWLWGWNVRVNGIRLLFSETFVVLTADQFVGRDDGLLGQQKQDSHVCRRNGTFPLILRKNQSPHYKGDEV